MVVFCRNGTGHIDGNGSVHDECFFVAEPGKKGLFLQSTRTKEEIDDILRHTHADSEACGRYEYQSTISTNHASCSFGVLPG